MENSRAVGGVKLAGLFVIKKIFKDLDVIEKSSVEVSILFALINVRYVSSK